VQYFSNHITEGENKMKKSFALVIVLCAIAAGAHAQEAKTATPAPDSQAAKAATPAPAAQAATTAAPASMTASLNKSLGLYVFPAKEQKPDQQATDEQACYTWAVEQSGIDPVTMTATVPDSVAKGPDGSAVKGAAKGAVAGVAIGAIAGDAGKGAAIGAAAGGMAGLSGGKKKQAQKEQQAKEQAAATDQAKIDSFKKAYSACLEGKGYTVK
jgi:hypothetical protein